MQEFPEESENREKDYVVARCPLLRNFISNIDETDQDAWLNNLKLTSAIIFSDVSSHIGDKKFDDDMDIIVERADSHEVFNNGLNRNDREFWAKLVLTLGFELTTEKDVELFYGDIFQKLFDVSVVRNTFDAAIFTRHALIFGSICKNQPKSEDVVDDVQEVWKEAIEKLNFGDK